MWLLLVRQMSDKKLSAFIAKAEEAQPKNENSDLEMVKLERDVVHSFTLEEVVDFEGQFGLSTCAIITLDDEKVKTFFNGVEKERRVSIRLSLYPPSMSLKHGEHTSKTQGSSRFIRFLC